MTPKSLKVYQQKLSLNIFLEISPNYILYFVKYCNLRIQNIYLKKHSSCYQFPGKTDYEIKYTKTISQCHNVNCSHYQINFVNCKSKE